MRRGWHTWQRSSEVRSEMIEVEDGDEGADGNDVEARDEGAGGEEDEDEAGRRLGRGRRRARQGDEDEGEAGTAGNEDEGATASRLSRTCTCAQSNTLH